MDDEGQASRRLGFGQNRKGAGVSVEYLVTGADGSKLRENADVDELVRDIRHLSSDDLNLARSVVHRLTVPAS